MAGKGCKQRPIKKVKFDTNFDEINWKKDVDDSMKLVKVKGKLVLRKVYK